MSTGLVHPRITASAVEPRTVRAIPLPACGVMVTRSAPTAESRMAWPAAASCTSVETGTSGLKAASSLRYDAAVTKSSVTSRYGISAPSVGPAATRYRLSRENRRRFLSGERDDARRGLERTVERGWAVTSSCSSGPCVAVAYFLVRVASPWLTRSSNVCAVFGWVARNTAASAMSSA